MSYVVYQKSSSNSSSKTPNHKHQRSIDPKDVTKFIKSIAKLSIGIVAIAISLVTVFAVLSTLYVATFLTVVSPAVIMS